MDASKRISDLVEIGRNLLDLLGEENKALRGNDYHRVHDFVQRKTDLIRAFETRFEGLSEHASEDDMAEVDNLLRDDLRQIGKTLDEMIKENSKLLLIAMEVQRRVIDSIAEAVKTAHKGPGTYSASGAVTDNRKAAKTAASFSYDQAL